jgi:hypothetical protein
MPEGEPAVASTKATPAPKTKTKTLKPLAPSVGDVSRKLTAVAQLPQPAARMAEVVDLHGASRDAQGRRPKPAERRDGQTRKPWTPEHMAAWEAATSLVRANTYFNGPNAPFILKCDQTTRLGLRCRKPAVRGTTRCMSHGGTRVVEERTRQKYADYRPDKMVLAIIAVHKAVRAGVFPLELLKDPQIARIMHKAIRGIKYDDPAYAGWTLTQRRLHRESACFVALRLVAAWERVQTTQDYTAWGETLRRATELGL